MRRKRKFCAMKECLRYALVCSWLLPTTGCVRSSTHSPPVVQKEESILRLFPAGSLGMQESDISRYLAISEGVYYLMPMDDVVAEVGEPDRRVENLEHLRNFRLPAKAYALVWDLGRYACYVAASRVEGVVSTVIVVDRDRNLGYDATGSKADVLRCRVTIGMTEAEVLAILGEPDRVVDRRPGQFPGEHCLYYEDTVPGSSDMPVVVVFSNPDRKVIFVGWEGEI